MQFVRTVANRVIFLDGGKIVEDGTAAEVFHNPKNQRTREFLRACSKTREEFWNSLN
jgi:ABC-type polar amino acid transport system ATPase subunit